MYLRSEHDREGFFKFSGTIDWCEPNYNKFYVIAEFQNTITSLAICFGGLVGLYWSFRYQHSNALKIFALLVAVVGLGSAIFHSTLTFVGQLFDEIPMLLAIFSYYFIFLEAAKSIYAIRYNWYQKLLQINPILASKIDFDLNDHSGYLKSYRSFRIFYPLSKSIQGTIFSFLGYNASITITIIMCLITIIHAIYGFVLVFQTAFFIMTTFAVTCLIETLYLYSDPKLVVGEDENYYSKNVLHSYKRWLIYYISTVLIAFTFWLIDNHFCDYLLSFPIYISGHGLWHIFNYFSTYSGIVLAAYALQMSSQNCQVDIKTLHTLIELYDTTTNPSAKLPSWQIPLFCGHVQEVQLSPSYCINLCSPQIGVLNLAPSAEIIV